MSDNLFDPLVDDLAESSEMDPELYLQQLLDDPDLVQHITRTETDGKQTLVGYFRIEFQPQQQRQVLHVPFSPPFASIPHVEAHALDDQNVRVRLTDRQKYGLRVELILSKATDSPLSLMIEIVATEAV